MSQLIEAKKAVLRFLKENIKCHDIMVIKLEKGNEIWKSVAEVYEDDAFLKSMNLPPKQVRNFYSVRMDENLEVISFERVSSFDAEEHDKVLVENNR